MELFPSSRILRWALCVALLLVACPDGEADRESAPQPVWPDSDLVAVDVVDDEHAIVVAATGEIYLTSDSGLSWQHGRMPAVTGLSDVSMADRDFGWAVGHGFILRTEEGGSSWSHQRFPKQADQARLVSVSAIDRERAIAVGEDGIRLRTQDGGRTWQDVSRLPIDPSDRPVSMNDVFCDSESKGRCWAVGEAIQRTNDAGRTWQHVEVEDFARFDSIVFGIGEVEAADPEAERFKRFLSENRHRTQVEWRIEPGIDSRELEEIGRRRDPDALFALIDARMEEIRSMLEEGGVASDRVVATGEPPWDYEDYLDDDPDFLEQYWIERSASKPSVRVRIVDDPRIFSLYVDTRGLGLAVGAAGALLRSDDRGENWITTERISPHDLLAVGIGRRRVVVVGAQGGLWLSQDDGVHWRAPAQQRQAPFFDALRSVSFSPSGDFGMIVGERGRMLRSVDGGAEWNSLARDGS